MQIKFQAKIYSVTGLLVLSNVVLFVMMVIIDGTQSVLENLPVTQLIHWGANYGPLTLNGEYWRLLTYAFLQAHLWHLLVNMFALVFIGPYVERYLGKARYLLTYLFAAIMGGLMSLTMLPTAQSVGASGAIFGLCGAAILAEKNVFIDNPEEADSKPVSWKLKLAVMTMFLFSNYLVARLTPGVDLGAHIGGLLGGIMAAALFSNSIRLKEKGRLLETFGIAAGLVIIFADSTIVTKHFGNDPNLAAHLQFDIGSDLAQEGRFKESLPYFARALKHIETELKPIVLINIAKANEALDGQEIVALQNIVKAENQEFASPNPDSETHLAIMLEILERKGVILTTLGEYGEAARIFKEAIGMIPDEMKSPKLLSVNSYNRVRANLFNDLAWCQAATENLDEAKSNADKSLELERNASAALDTRGVILILQKHPDAAITDLTQAISVSPTEGAGYFHRSIAYRMLGKKNEANADMANAALRKYKPDPWERAKFSNDLTDLESRTTGQAETPPGHP